jgi:anti-anti-sigma regulatory factor
MISSELILDELSLDSTADQASPNTVVLQPNDNFSDLAGISFRTLLGHALVQADAVVVDLLWIDTIDQAGLSILLSGMTQAVELGKSLSFLSMNQQTRSTLDSSWEKLREDTASAQVDVFTPEFEQFLDHYQSHGIAAA